MAVGDPNSENVWTGGPDQASTGPILTAPLATAIPADPLAGPWTGYVASGYISDAGVTLSLSKSFESIKDWSGAVVRRILTEFDGSAKYAHLEMSEEAVKDTFGAGNVVVTAATNAHGKQLKVSIGADDLPAKRYVYKIKDGSRRVILVFPNADVTEVDDIAFVKNDVIRLSVTVGAMPDATGKSIYIYTDDGVTI